MTLTTSHEVSREGGGGGGRLRSWKKGRKERGGDGISAAFQDFSEHSAKLKYDCSLCTGKEGNHLNEKLAALAGQAHSYINVV